MSNEAFRLSDFLPYQLSVASNAVSNSIARAYHDKFGLKITEWRVMAVLGDSGSLTQRELAERTVMDKVAVNRACKTLEKRALAVRVPNQQDGRSHHLELTGEGRAMHAEIIPLALSMESQLLEPLSGKQRGELTALLELIRSQAA